MDRLLIKHRLLDRDLSLASLARQTGMTYDRLVRVVNGNRQATTEEVEAIANVLGLSPDAISSDT